MTSDVSTTEFFTLKQEQSKQSLLKTNPNALLKDIPALPIWLQPKSEQRPLETYFDYTIKKYVLDQKLIKN